MASVGELEDTFTDLFWRILGPVDEDGTGSRDVETSETGSAGSNGNGELQSEPSLAALGLSTDDANSPVSPELVDEPKGGVDRAGRQPRGLNDPQRRAHRRRPVVVV